MPRIERGQILSDRFLLLRRLERPAAVAESRMAETWLAEDSELGEVVALKIWPAGLGADALDRIEARCRPALSLHHPAIVGPRDFFQADEGLAMATPYFPDGNLGGAEIPTPKHLAETLSVVADALATAHANGQAHGNLHEGNVLMGPGGLPVLCDFRSSEDESEPESSPGPREDLRALGVMAESRLHHVPASPGDNTGTRERLLAIARRLREANLESDASTTSAFQAELALLARDDTFPRDASSTIQPTPVEPPMPSPSAAIAAKTKSGTTEDNSRTLILGAFGILLLIAMGVFTLLPRLVEEPASPPSPEPMAVVEAEVADTPPAQSEDEDWEGEAALLEIQTELEALEGRDALKWAAQEMSALRKAHESANGLYLEGKTREAKARYEGLPAQLEALQSRATELAGEATLDGDQALESHDIAAATEAYERALRMDPANPAAEGAARRLAVAEQVFTLLQASERLERQEEFESARASLIEALELDPARSGTTRALARVDAEINRMQFVEEMSRGLDALASGRSQSARNSFEKAREIRPESAAPGDGLAQAAEMSRAARLGSLKRKAEEAESQEEYGQALENYKAALAMGPHLQFALEGTRRTEALASVDRELKRLLSDRSRLESGNVQEEATALLERISRLPGKGPRMTESARRLSEWLGVAETPVAVTFASDGATQVMVYRVGKLGSFLTRELKLLPGTYTVVGSRDGYRDVRRSITIEAGQKPAPVLIECKERF